MGGNYSHLLIIGVDEPNLFGPDLMIDADVFLNMPLPPF